MPNSKAVIVIKVNGGTVVHADTEYIADSCFINENNSWIHNLKVNGQIEIIVTPSIEPPTRWDRIRLCFWNFLYRFVKVKEED